MGDIPEPDIFWGAVMGESILNYYLREVAAAQGDSKLVSKWGKIKGF